jgi:hypothetical protein
VASHERSWARHRSISNPDHELAAKVLRAAHRELAVLKGSDDVEERDLSVYDRATGTM